jgi:hypothetical protein
VHQQYRVLLAEMAENIVLDYKKHEAEDLRVPPEELAAEHISASAVLVQPCSSAASA